MKDNIPILTEEQITTINAEWARGVTSIQDLTRTVFNDPTLDGRTNQGKAIKLYLASRGDQIKTTKGKDLEKMSKDDLEAHFAEFRRLLPPCPVVQAWDEVTNITSAMTADERYNKYKELRTRYSNRSV